VLDGEAFEQEDYFKLVYRPGHHHYSRHFAVLFDAPLAGACGLRVEDVNDLDGDLTARVSTVDCALEPIETRDVSAETYVGG
jgi:hypothetical protein